MAEEDIVRRPISARDTRVAGAVARFLAGRGVKPNAISIASVVCAAAGGVCLLAAGPREGGALAICYLLAAVCVQARLLCNLFDGMVAIEGGFKTKSGEIFNDLPDRIADPLLLVAAGYSVSAVTLSNGWVPGPLLGWLAGLGAVLTAYARVLGGACGLKQRFSGPMAKQHRMAVLTVSLVVAAGLAAAGMRAGARWLLMLALAVIAVGCLVTLVRRTRAIIDELEARP